MSVLKNRRKAVGDLFLASLLSLIAGCSGYGQVGRPFIQIVASSTANDTSPIPVTLVAIYEPQWVEKLMRMSAKDWYEKREQLRRDHSGSAALAEWDWMMNPGQTSPPMMVEVDRRTVAWFVFARYHSPGTHRFALDTYQGLCIELKTNHFVVQVPYRFAH